MLKKYRDEICLIIKNHFEKLLILILCFSILFTWDIRIFSITMHTTIYYIVTFIIAVLFLLKIKERNLSLPAQIKSVDYFVLIAFCYNLCFMISKIIKNNIFYEPEVIVMTLCIIYAILSRTCIFQRRYLYYTWVSFSFAAGGIFYKIITGKEDVFWINGIIRDSTVVISFTLMFTVINIIIYCTEQNKKLQIIAAVFVLLSNIIMFLQNNWIAILFVGLLFLLIPILLTPTAQLIKKNMQMAFLYFFLLSNMGAFSYRYNLQNILPSYDITLMIYIDLIIAVFVLLFSWYWERIPQSVNLKDIIMNRFRIFCRFILISFLIAFFSIPFIGGRLDTLSERTFGVNTLSKFVKVVQYSYYSMEGTLYSAMKEYGIIGVIYIMALFSLIAYWLKKNYDRTSDESGILTLLGIIYLVQSLFMKQSILTTPFYLVFVVFAIYRRKAKRKKSTINESMEEQHEEILPESFIDNTTGY